MTWMNQPMVSQTVLEKEEMTSHSLCDAVCEHDDEVTETKIRAFLDEKAFDLKKLQTPLYEEFFNTSNVSTDSPCLEDICKENAVKNTKLPPEGKPSPSKVVSGMLSVSQVNIVNSMSLSRSSRRFSCAEVESSRILKEIQSPRYNEWGDLIQEAQPETYNSQSASERHKKWKEELDQELGIIVMVGEM